MNKLSIVVPTYNVEKYLPRCIDSIINQEYKNLEIILVDDGSTDQSGEICDTYARKDKRVKVIHKENGGLISSRMTGLANATGRYISFVDGDDWIEQNTYLDLMSAANGHPYADIMIGGYVTETEKGEVKRPFIFHEPTVLDKTKALENMFREEMYNWSLCDKIYRIELFDKEYRWITQNPYGEDTELNWFLFHRAKCVYFLPVYGYHYMSRESSMMRSKFSWDFMAYLDRMDFILSNIGKFERCLKKPVLRVFFNVGISYMFRAILLRGDDSYQKMKFGIYRNMLLKHVSEPALELSEDAYEVLRVIAEEHDSPAEHYDSIEKQFAERIRDFCRDYQVVFVYGAGIYAKKLAGFMEKHDIRFQGFAVTEKGNSDEYVGYPVMLLEHVIEKYGSACGFVLGLSEKNRKEVVSILQQKNIHHFLRLNIYVLQHFG